jgi:hypothetical protein
MGPPDLGLMNDRRKLLVAMGLATLPFGVLAQQAKVWRIGFLGLAPASGWASQIEALKTGLRELGYSEGKNIVIEFRWAPTVDQFPELAAELVRMEVDLIIAPASTQVEPAPGKRQKRFPSFSPNMPTQWALATSRASAAPAATSPVYRWFSPR